MTKQVIAISLVLITAHCCCPCVALNAGGRVKLSVENVGGKVVIAERGFAAQEEIFYTSPNHCLTSQRSGEIDGLQGQTDLLWESCGDLRFPVSEEDASNGRTWDTQLACALLDATGGSSLALEGPFWDNFYSVILPRPEQMTVPFCFPLSMLDHHLQIEKIANGAKLQKSRLLSLFPALSQDRNVHRISQYSLALAQGRVEAVPTPIEWAFALVRSRCFKISEDAFAFIPMIDMCNHAVDPNAQFVSKIESESPRFVLEATRPIAPGDEITISYGEGYSNERLFVQYGFIIESNPHDVVSLPPPSALRFGNLPTLASVDGFKNAIAQVVALLAQSSSSLSNKRLFTPGRAAAATKNILSRVDTIASSYFSTQSTQESLSPSPLPPSSVGVLGGHEQEQEQEQERRVALLIAALIGDLKDVLASMPTTLAHDEATLAGLDSIIAASHSVLKSNGGAPVPLPFYRCQSGAAGGEREWNAYQLRACVCARAEYKRVVDCMLEVLHEAASVFESPVTP